MNVKNVKKWIKALRSGWYKQTRGRLCGGKGYYCCLGVACRVAGLRPNELWEECLLPESVSNWLGIESDDPKIGDDLATALNDNLGLSFRKIADRIELYWLGYEVLATQGQGPVVAGVFKTFQAARSFVKQHKGEASFCIQRAFGEPRVKKVGA